MFFKKNLKYIFQPEEVDDESFVHEGFVTIRERTRRASGRETLQEVTFVYLLYKY